MPLFSCAVDVTGSSLLIGADEERIHDGFRAIVA
jgi:hypothetical protein